MLRRFSGARVYRDVRGYRAVDGETMKTTKALLKVRLVYLLYASVRGVGICPAGPVEKIELDTVDRVPADQA